MKKIIVASAILLSLTSFVFAEMMISSSSQISVPGVFIPQEAYEYVSEEDLIEALCYEAKWKGGEGVAKIEALNELIGPALSSVREVGVNVDDVNLEDKAVEMRQKLEAVCFASTVAEASQKIDEYISFADNLRFTLEGSFRTTLQGMESDLREKGEELREMLELELGEEGRRLAKEVEDDLRRVGEEEGRALESQLRQLGNEFESFMSRGDVNFSEASAKARELSGRISADPTTTSFLSSKFGELLNEAATLAPRAMSGEITPIEIRNIVSQKVPGVVGEIKSFMVQKYERIGEEEEARIRSELENRADEIGGEQKAKLETIRDHFDNFDERLDNLYSRNMSEWQEYEEKSLQKKREIIVKAVDNHFEEAKKLIQEKKENIDMAVEEGVAEEYGIMSYEQLMEEIDRDREEIINKFMSSDISMTAIASVQREFQDKWNNYREKMEAIEMVSAEDAIEKILGATDWDNVLSRMSTAIREMNRRYSGRNNFDRYMTECSEDPTLFNPPEITGGRKRYISNNCINCRILEEVKELVEQAEKIDINNLESSQETVRSHIFRFRNSSANMTLKQVMQFKNELMDAVNAFVEIEDVMNEAYNNYNQARERVRDICIVYTEERGTPNPPTVAPEVICRVAGPRQINISWDHIIGANRYYIYRCTGDDCSPRSLMRDQAGTMWSDSRQTSPGMSYSYRVRANNAGGYGPYSQIVTCNLPN